MTKLLTSVSGIRGIVGDSLTPEIAMAYGRAFGGFLKRGDVVLGRDTRFHGPMIAAAVAAGLMSSGRNVIDIGVATTPAIEYAVREMMASGGIAVTASHNPIEYNALKLIGPGGLFLTESQGKRFMKSTPATGAPRGDKIRRQVRIGFYDIKEGWDLRHIQAILGLKLIDQKMIARAKFRVAGDCVNGTASFVAAELFNALGCEVKLINAVPDGNFPRPPEPTPDNLKQLGRAVRSFKADIGFAFDPDSDRLAIVDGEGRPLGEEYTLALGMRYILRRQKGPIAVNLSSSMLNDFVAREAGVDIYRTKVGEINVTEKLRRVGGVAGGEGNGGLIYPEMHYGRDGLMAAAVILQYLAAERKTIFELAQELPKTYMVKRKITLGGRRLKFDEIARSFGKGRVDKRDGIKIVLDNGWFQLRLSNTEPIARLITEACDASLATELADRVEKLIA